VTPMVLTRMEQRWCEELGLRPRCNLGEVEPLAATTKPPTGGVIGTCHLLGIVGSLETHALAACGELRRPGAVWAPANEAEPSDSERLATTA
jgi:hypothetical protein